MPRDTPQTGIGIRGAGVAPLATWCILVSKKGTSCNTRSSWRLCSASLKLEKTYIMDIF